MLSYFFGFHRFLNLSEDPNGGAIVSKGFLKGFFGFGFVGHGAIQGFLGRPFVRRIPFLNLSRVAGSIFFRDARFGGTFEAGRAGRPLDAL